MTGVNIGLECDIPAILPVSFYLCSRTSPSFLFDGQTFPGQKHPVKLSPLAYRAHADFQYNLSVETSVEARAEHMEFPLCNDDRAQCTTVLTSILHVRTLLMSNQSEECLFENYEAERIRQHPNLPPFSICKDCATRFHDREQRIQLKIWSLLPKMCNLGNWEELSA